MPAWYKGVVTAGAIFLGHHSPTVLGDYVAGLSHVLLTGGAGALFRLDRGSVPATHQSCRVWSKSSTKAPAVRAFAGMEGLDAHGQSAESVVVDLLAVPGIFSCRVLLPKDEWIRPWDRAYAPGEQPRVKG